MFRWSPLGLIVLTFLLAACGGKSEPGTDLEKRERVANPNCPARAKAKPQLPNTAPELSTLGYWLSALSPEQQSQVLLEPEALATQDLALRRTVDTTLRFVDLTHLPDDAEVKRELEQRLSMWRERFNAGSHVLARGGGKAEMESAAAKPFEAAPSLHVALASIALHCTPLLEVVRSVAGDKRFDRNMCSQVRPQEPVEVLGRLGHVRLARSAYAVGFIADDAPLSAPVPAELDAPYRAGHELKLLRALTLENRALEADSMLVAAGENRAWIAGERGFARSRPLLPEEARSSRRALTRAALLADAFSYMGAPYGLGDEGGGRDCSRFVLDVLRSFGLHLPRTSVQQSRSGVYVVEVPSEASEIERQGLLDEAAQRGLVLLHFPGHIAIYLGRDKSSVPRLIHSFAEYLSPCPGGGETLVEVGRVAVSDLTLGKGTSRRSFLQRMTRLSVFGQEPGQGLLALSSFRPALPPESTKPSTCNDDGSVGLFESPQKPHAGQSLRVIAVSANDMRPAGLWLIDPNGQLVSTETHDLGVGPYARWTELATPLPGAWTALVADGSRVLGCEQFHVRAGPAAAAEPRAPDAPAWRKRNDWDENKEALYAAFVEQLFGLPTTDMRSWGSLSELLRDPQRNLLHDYLAQGEDAQLALAPDCADLPYFLRAYFAWKLGLPFGFHHCSRGREGQPPRCSQPTTQQVPIEASDDVAAFDVFIRREVSAGVHSASGRTLPTDLASDLYPLPLTRAALRPGSVFVDPYGHLIVVAQWVPQGVSGQGMLLGADAQPDAMVGRRRFWQGNFLFTPETRDVGAGFKAFRPLPAQAAAAADGGVAAPLEVKEADFARHGASRPSLEQYQGSLDEFYARLDQLIYPRPVAVEDRMRQLVDALEEQVQRRVEAVDIGEAYVRAHPGPIVMPEGHAIFETEGAWEDFATPSRDLRLLIAIDAVLGFAQQVRDAPARFLADAASVRAVPKLLKALLEARHFRYKRSDDTLAELSLSELVGRAGALETAYNPNDCVEKRWGATLGSDEHAPCKRHAPPEQQREMERYRAWFQTRTRPARP